ncbi:STAS domain-containing protein [Microbacterium stercoris]|uniref:Anti-sigma factor antagonist n=1 Tax=Microbacterium stercoris TaxID=2820289 RepID=A0A939QKY8_9MICO|nr:STAS domain-containing protein [Microbacterium stercoris]MBO3664819.1 STAS domain-containing protein [Microbacterium stercoris]
MDIDEAVRQDATVLGLSGRLNLVSAGSLKSRIDALVAGGTSRLVIDLTAVDFIDSSGLGALIGGLKTARQAGGDLRLAAASEQVLAVLGLTNLDRILTPYATVDEACREW